MVPSSHLFLSFGFKKKKEIEPKKLSPAYKELMKNIKVMKKSKKNWMLIRAIKAFL